MPIIFKLGDNGETVKYESSSYKDAVAVAEAADKHFLTTDFKYDEWALVVHEEGTQLLFRNSFIKEWKDWVFIYTEHHKTHVYHKTDLTYYGYLKEVSIEKLKGTGIKDHCYDCKKEFDVDDLLYKAHPAPNSMKFDPDFIVPLCEACYQSAWDYSAECDK